MFWPKNDFCKFLIFWNFGGLRCAPLAHCSDILAASVPHRLRVALTLLHGRQLGVRVLETVLDGSQDLELLGDLGDLHLGRHGSRRKKLEATSKAWSERLDPKGLGEKYANPLRVECSS